MQEEIEGIKKFLRENEDLKEKLAPQMEQLQKRVDEHERQINVLNERVDQLEVKVTQGEWVRFWAMWARSHSSLFTAFLEPCFDTESCSILANQHILYAATCCYCTSLLRKKHRPIEVYKTSIY